MHPPISRRTFLAGTGATLLLAACGGGDDEAADTPSRSTTSTTTAARSARGTVAVGLLSSQLLAGVDERVAFALLRDNRPLGRGTTVEVAFGPDQEHLGPRQAAEVHDDGIPTPYFRATTKVAGAGKHVMEVRVDGQVAQVSPLEFVDPAGSQVPVPGERLVSVATPTPRDPRGVDPICTSKPACPLHDLGLPDALASGKPLAVLFATPALCASRLCGPVLDVLLEQQATYGERVTMLHVEVYTNLQDFQLTEGMKAYGLTFEPVLFLARGDGTIAERLQGSYDNRELDAALGRLVS